MAKAPGYIRVSAHVDVVGLYAPRETHSDPDVYLGEGVIAAVGARVYDPLGALLFVRLILYGGKSVRRRGYGASRTSRYIRDFTYAAMDAGELGGVSQ